MIVLCKEIYNPNIKQFIDFDEDLTIGKHYNVLEIGTAGPDLFYRIISDDCGIDACSVLVPATNFEIISDSVPINWILHNEYLYLSPAIWRHKNLWEESFWQDYNENRPAALECYRDEIKTIIATDKGYISTMIKERADDSRYDRWRECMLPLFEEVLKEDTA